MAKEEISPMFAAREIRKILKGRRKRLNGNVEEMFSVYHVLRRSKEYLELTSSKGYKDIDQGVFFHLYLQELQNLGSRRRYSPGTESL